MPLDINKLNLNWIEWLIVTCAAEDRISKVRAARELGISLSDFLIKYKEQLKYKEEYGQD